MSIVVNPKGDTLYLAGDLSLGAHDVVRKAADRILDEYHTLIIDMAGVAVVNSVGLTALIHCIRRTARHSEAFALRNLPPKVQRLLDITGLLRVIHVLPPSAPRDA